MAQRPATHLLSQRELRAAHLLAGGATIDNVAKQLVVNRSNVWRWSKLPLFLAEMEAMRRSTTRAVQDLLRRGAVRSAELLVKVVEDEASPVRERMVAARTLLDGYKSFGDQAARGLDAFNPDAIPVTWDETLIKFAVQVRRLMGDELGATEAAMAPSPGRALARAGLSERVYRELENIADDPVAVRRYCDDLLRQVEARGAKNAFAEHRCRAEGDAKGDPPKAPEAGSQTKSPPQQQAATSPGGEHPPAA